MHALLRAEDGYAVAAVGVLFPGAHDRLFRGDRQRARHCVALRGLILAARFVLRLVAEHGLAKGERIGVDGSTMEDNAALRTIMRRDDGESYRQMLTRMAKESGIDTPGAENLARLDRTRKGKTLSNTDWKSPRLGSQANGYPMRAKRLSDAGIAETIGFTLTGNRS